MKLEIPRKVYEKVMYWVQKADFEVSGFGTVIWDEKRQAFVVQDACLLKQEGGSAHTDIEAAAIGRLMYEMHKRKIPGELKWWWHSHVNMAVFWSKTDEETIKDLGKNGWMTATVFNKKTEMRSAFCAQVQSSFADGVPKSAVAGIMKGPQMHMVDHIDTEIPDYYNLTEMRAWDKEFDMNVTEKKPVFDNSRYGYNSNWNQGNLIDIKGNAIVTADEDEDDLEILKEEAAYLGMSVREYRHILDHGTTEQRLNLQARVEDYYEMLETAEVGNKHGVVT